MLSPQKITTYLANVMGFFATKPLFIKIKHLLVQFKTM